MKVEPLTATIGAEIAGVDLASPLSEDAITAIRAATLATGGPSTKIGAVGRDMPNASTP